MTKEMQRQWGAKLLIVCEQKTTKPLPDSSHNPSEPTATLTTMHPVVVEPFEDEFMDDKFDFDNEIIPCAVAPEESESEEDEANCQLVHEEVPNATSGQEVLQCRRLMLSIL